MNRTSKLVSTSLVPLALLAPLLLAACGASPTASKGAAPEGGPDATATASDTAAAATPSAEAGAGPAQPEPKPVSKKSKIEQCADVGNAMQLGQKVGPIANVNDGPKLRQIAGELRKGADDLSKIAVGLSDLETIRGTYVETMRGMAEALETAADSKESSAQKAAVERFRKLEPKLNELIGQLNTVCNTPSR